MDDLIPTRTPQQEAFLRELERRSRDQLLVFNPTNEDQFEIFDRYKYGPIPNKNKDIGYGKGMAVLPRFVAINYFDHMYTKILFSRRDELIATENEARSKRGSEPLSKFDGPNSETSFIFQRGLGDNPAKKGEIIASLYKGIYEEFGKDQVQVSESEQKRDLYNVTDILGELDKGGGYKVAPENKNKVKKPAMATAPVSNVQPPAQFDVDDLESPDQVEELTK